MSENKRTQTEGSQSDRNPRDDSPRDGTATFTVMDQVLSPAWLTQAPHNWTWAERSDKIEEKAFRSMEDARRRLTTNAEKALSSHVDFVSHRLNADMECFRQLAACRLPDETMKTLQGFLRNMWQDYESQAQRSFALLQDTLTETVASAEALTETAIESVVALESAVEEEVTLTESEVPVTATPGPEAETVSTAPASAPVQAAAADMPQVKAAAASTPVKTENQAARPRKSAGSRTARKPARQAPPRA